MTTISFVVPCYNSADYMHTCIDSLLAFGSDIEIIIVNDGSQNDNTLEIAQNYHQNYPDVVKVIDQENRGHGGAVNHGLAQASGLYFKVVDSDDWLDTNCAKTLMAYLRSQATQPRPCDLVITNYIYDKVSEGTQQRMSYTNVFPVEQEFSWNSIGTFKPSQYLLMHSAIYRTDLLKESGIQLPEHCFYVDNIFVYEPLPYVNSLYYFNMDLYHYYIGREDQSVNEAVMYSRIDQQLAITRHMIDAHDLNTLDQPKLSAYMYNYLSMMMCICSVFLRMEQTSENEEKRSAIWQYLMQQRPGMYAKIRGGVLNLLTNLPSPVGHAIGLGGYRIAQKIFKFN